MEMTNVCPNDIDPLVWRSLPSDIQQELTQERLVRGNMDMKSDDIMHMEKKPKKSNENTQSNLITNWTNLSPPCKNKISDLTDSQSINISEPNNRKIELKSKIVLSPVKVMKQLSLNSKNTVEINNISTGKFVDLEFPATADSIDGRYIQKRLLSAPSR
jgi:hypothetical protein